MAVAAYTSLVSLSNLLDDVYNRIEIQYPALDAQPFDSLREGVNFLIDFVAAHSHRKSEKLKSLWRQIVEVANEADDIIDAHVVDLLYKESHGEETSMGHSTYEEDMDRVNQMIDIFKTELLTAIEEGENTEGEHEKLANSQGQDEEGEDTQGQDIQALKHAKVSSSAQDSSDTLSHAKDGIVVGLDKKVIEIMGQLASNEADLQVITITGMGGIGKTTLAKTVYDSPYVAEYFVVRLWVVVSQEYVAEKLLQGLLDSGEKKFFYDLGVSGEHSESGESFSELGGKLYKGLYGRRYIVVMDDVWSDKVWDDLKRFFPNNRNGSRIVMTTRNSIVASLLSSTSNMNTMDFLDSDRSWKLLCQNAFSDEVCPNSELEKAGKNIAEGCKGLPLSIVVIGSMLASSKMTREYWESVANDVNTFRNSGDEGHCLEILSLSYNNLPIHLKACFLQMRRYPEDCQINVKGLINEWLAEGLIQPIQHRSLESLAEEYFMALVYRNLILIHECFPNGDARRCKVHDLVRDLSCREYHKDPFIHFPRYQTITITSQKKMCVLCCQLCGDKEELNFPSLALIPPSSSQVSPLICEACGINYQHIKRLTLVKVMDIVGEDSGQELVHATKMKFIIVEIPNDLKFISPSFAHLLWRLQSLCIFASDPTTSIVLPSEIWKMPQLRVIAVDGAVLTYPENTDIEEKDFIILKDLHTLQDIRNFMCTPEVVCRIPNLKVLTISDRDNSWVNYSPCNLSNLRILEWLEVVKPIFSLENMSFPNSLKDLYLVDTEIPWNDIAMIGSLPYLERLELQNACIGPDWNPTEGEFLRLKVLVIESTCLLYWKAEDIHFPNLEWLILRRILHELEIASSIGDIPTLKGIQLEHCSDYVINCAKQIWGEQQEYGNEMLRVCVTDRDGRYFEFGDES